jgi:Ca-activated chloride channel family protein
MNHALFHQPLPRDPRKEIFEKLLKLFLDLLMKSGGNITDALRWLSYLDSRNHYTSSDYTLGDFIRDLKEQGYITHNPSPNQPVYVPSAKAQIAIREKSLEEIFQSLRMGSLGDHSLTRSGPGDTLTYETRPYEFGDRIEHLHITETLNNAYLHHGLDEFRLTQEDLSIIQTEYKTQAATFVLIDASHSMVLYGEDRITPAKKVAIALAELIRRKYPKDYLFIGAFGDYAWQLSYEEVPFLQAGPHHTNTRDAIELALSILAKVRTPNKQIFLITDGKPTCIKENGRFYRNSFGMDPKIINKTLEIAERARREKVIITTFMVAKDLYLQRFVHRFTEINGGRAYYAHPQEIGKFVFEDFIRNRRKELR